METVHSASGKNFGDVERTGVSGLVLSAEKVLEVTEYSLEGVVDQFINVAQV